MKVMSFKHIKRPEEVPPRPLESTRPECTALGTSYREEEPGLHSISVPLSFLQEVSEGIWREAVYLTAVSHGYDGTMHEFFCWPTEVRSLSSGYVKFMWSAKQNPQARADTDYIREWSDWSEKKYLVESKTGNPYEPYETNESEKYRDRINQLLEEKRQVDMMEIRRFLSEKMKFASKE